MRAFPRVRFEASALGLTGEIVTELLLVYVPHHVLFYDYFYPHLAGSTGYLYADRVLLGIAIQKNIVLQYNKYFMLYIVVAVDDDVLNHTPAIYVVANPVHDLLDRKISEEHLIYKAPTRE